MVKDISYAIDEVIKKYRERLTNFEEENYVIRLTDLLEILNEVSSNIYYSNLDNSDVW